MTATNCPRCGRLFNKIHSPVCQACEKREEEQFKVLREYIEEEPLATITEVSDATGVPTKRILRYIREGRLQVPEGMIPDVRCTQCGVPITEGSFCTTCARKLAKDMTEVYAGAPTVEEATAPKKEARFDRRGVGMHIDVAAARRK